MPETNPCVIVRQRAKGIPGPETFILSETGMPSRPKGGILVRVLYASVDPTMRGWLSSEANHMTVPDGAVMRANGIGEVIDSDHPNYRIGELVYGFFGWAAYFAASDVDIFWKIDTSVAPAPTWLGTLGFTGITAWLGFRYFGKPKPGETVIVTTAAGAVGSVVGQLAREDGLRAIGIAGGPDKAQKAMAEFGYDSVIDYHATNDLPAAIAAATPDGIDLFYDNVAGQQADAIFHLLNLRARIVQCGTASVTDWLPLPSGPRRERYMLIKRLTWLGFVVRDHADLYPLALADLSAQFLAGKLVSYEDVLEGIESAPYAIQKLYAGENRGKLCIRI